MVLHNENIWLIDWFFKEFPIEVIIDESIIRTKMEEKDLITEEMFPKKYPKI